MLAFYRCSLASDRECKHLSVLHRDQMINFHRPAHWQDKRSRASSRCKTPCGDLVCVDGTPESLNAMLVALEQSSLKAQSNARAAQRAGSSVYVRESRRQPLEFMIMHNWFMSRGAAQFAVTRPYPIPTLTRLFQDSLSPPSASHILLTVSAIKLARTAARRDRDDFTFANVRKLHARLRYVVRAKNPTRACWSYDTRSLRTFCAPPREVVSFHRSDCGWP